jgi:hypothetical protein
MRAVAKFGVDMADDQMPDSIARSSITRVGEGNLASPMPPRCNQIGCWLNHIDGLRRAARHARRERLPTLSKAVTVGVTGRVAQQRANEEDMPAFAQRH